MSGSVQQRHASPRPQAPESQGTSRERRRRLLYDTDTVLAAIDDLVTPTRCQP